MCILLVEDEWITLMEADLALTAAGFEVLSAETGQRAFEEINKHPGRFTCLVTDHLMPGHMNGMELIELMRPHYPAIPIVLATATPLAVDPEWETRNRVYLLRKPFFSDELIGIVQRLMST